jgi:SpoVK/Ycf46/Vps4 family AAA+-type ATPase
MAAEIIAADAGLDMFKVDLATVVSKYIGETEENLKEIFDEAEHTDAVLFFDEADALFGERSEVSDSQDRYANVEVSYLLQRMEEHDGAVILASNFKENIDDAFLRRINSNVEFPRPDRESRAEIWRTIFPEEAPVGDLDIAFLSRFEITGGNIKNVALTASFLAADDDREGTKTVEMRHVVRALRRELQKTGRLVNPEEFGEYRDLVKD